MNLLRCKRCLCVQPVNVSGFCSPCAVAIVSPVAAPKFGEPSGADTARAADWLSSGDGFTQRDRDELAAEFAAVRADERKAIVEWLRTQEQGKRYSFAGYYAQTIEAGKHAGDK